MRSTASNGYARNPRLWNLVSWRVGRQRARRGCSSDGQCLLKKAAGAWGVASAAMLLWPALAAAASAASAEKRLTLAEVIDVAKAQNPQLHAAAERVRAARALPAQRAALDDPVVSWEAWNAPSPVGVDRADNNIFRVSQRLPFPGKRALAGTMASRDADAEGANADMVEIDVVAAVTKAFWSLWQSHERLRIYAREKDLAGRFARVAEQRYAVGETSQSDVVRAQVELTHFVNRLTTEGFAVDAARAELNALLSRDPQEPLGVPEDPMPPKSDLPVERLTELAFAHRPELVQQAAVIARERTGVELAHKAYLPDFEVSAGYFHNAHGREGVGAMLSATIPIAYKAKYDAGVDEASARLSAAEADRRRLEDLVRREVQQALLRLRAARLQHDLFVTTHIPQAEQALRVTEGAYQTGAVDFLSLIDTVRAITSVHLEHIEAAGELGKAYADLERAVGGPLGDGAVPAAAPRKGAGHHE